jgi:hypothetical protein
MFIFVPGWLWHAHRTFLLIYAAIALSLWALLGGAIARMAALHATRDERLSAARAVHFSRRRWGWFLGAPLIPVLILAILAVVLFIFGLLMFGIPYLHLLSDPVGGVLYLVPILLGLAFALVLIGLVGSANLLYPAIAVEGTDAFDANSRAYSYLIGRPWHLLFYNLAALVYGAITYLFLGTVIFLALLVAQKFVSEGAGLFLAHPTGESRFEDIVKAPQLGRLTYEPDTYNLRTTGQISAHLARIWVYLFVGLLAAYAISYYFCAQTWIYLLLRRSTDTTEFDQVHLEPTLEESDDLSMPNKIEPTEKTN